jgi:hypothetical protein
VGGELQSEGLDPSSFSPELKHFLEASGWARGEYRDIDGLLKDLNQSGYRATETAERLLRSLYGLSIEASRNDAFGLHPCEPLVVDPYEAALSGGLDTEGLSEEFGGSWFPVGTWLSYSSVYVEASGAMIATGMGWYWHLGDSIEESLELAICLDRPLRCLNLDPGQAPWPRYADGIWFESSVTGGTMSHVERHHP